MIKEKRWSVDATLEGKFCVKAPVRLADDDDEGCQTVPVDTVTAPDAAVGGPRLGCANLGHTGAHQTGSNTAVKCTQYLKAWDPEADSGRVWRPSALHADQWVGFRAPLAGEQSRPQDCVVQEFQLDYRRRRCQPDRCDRSKVFTDAHDAVMEVLLPSALSWNLHRHEGSDECCCGPTPQLPR